MSERRELLNAIKEGNLYDYVANNHHKFSVGELARVIMELDYAIYSNFSSAERNNVYEDMYGELKELWQEYEEEEENED